MSAAEVDVIRWGAERVRIGPWRGDARVAHLAPVADAPLPSVAFVRRCCRELASRGFQGVVTGALAPAEQRSFLAAGFQVEQELHLLAHDMQRLPPRPPAGPARLRRARNDDRDGVLRVDGQAFPPFWRLDQHGLDEALGATPAARFRVIDAGGVLAYAVTGRAGRRGFLQRLAVEPGHHRLGLGRALVIDGLHWLRRWRVDRSVVNTQIGNEPALALYESLGFRLQTDGLSVLSAGLTETGDGPPPAPVWP